MATIDAWVAPTAKSKLVRQRVELGPLGDEEVEVQVEHCGLCHSDISILNNEWGFSQFPAVLGHEAVGRVVEVGRASMDGPSRSDDGQSPQEPDTAEAPPVVSTDLVPLKPTEEGPTDLEPPPPPKQSQLKLHCPNCNSPGALPWGRLGSLLCCAHCWHWYRISGGGKLTEVPPPKNFVKGSLRAYNENGESRIIEVTRKDIKQKRREAQTRQNIAALKSLNVSDGMVLWMAATYTTLLALFLGYTMFRSTSAPLLPNAPSSMARGQTVNPRKKAVVIPSPVPEPDNSEATTPANSDGRPRKALRRGSP